MNTTTQTTKYNGWKNYETWNAALWIGNDESLYRMAKQCAYGNGVPTRNPYAIFVDAMIEARSLTTGDGVRWADKRISRVELNSMMREL